MIVACLLLCGGGQLALGELFFGDAWLTGGGECDGLLGHVSLSSGRGVFVGKTQEENCSSSVCGGARETLCEDWSFSLFAYFDDSEMSLTIEHVVTQLQQEVTTLEAPVADQTGLADAVQAINKLATAQVWKDTPSLIDVNGLGRPKDFSGKEEDFQQWSKKTEAFFASVIQESERMLEWAAEHVAEITTELIDLEFLPIRRTWSDECAI